MKIKEYIPNFCSGFDARVSDFSSKEDLLNIDWLKCVADYEDFSGYMVNGNYLMATYNYNTNKKPSWYVIGSFYDEETIHCVKKWFPQWSTPKYIMKNGDVVQVNEICGDRMEIRVSKSPKDENLISDFKKMTVTQKWFDENHSHNVFNVS